MFIYQRVIWTCTSRSNGWWSFPPIKIAYFFTRFSMGTLHSWAKHMPKKWARHHWIPHMWGLVNNWVKSPGFCVWTPHKMVVKALFFRQIPNRFRAPRRMALNRRFFQMFGVCPKPCVTLFLLRWSPEQLPHVCIFVCICVYYIYIYILYLYYMYVYIYIIHAHI